MVNMRVDDFARVGCGFGTEWLRARALVPSGLGRFAAFAQKSLPAILVNRGLASNSDLGID